MINTSNKQDSLLILKEFLIYNLLIDKHSKFIFR